MADVDLGTLLVELKVESAEMQKSLDEINESLHKTGEAVETISFMELYEKSKEAFEGIAEMVGEASKAFSENEAAFRRVAAVTNTFDGASKFRELAESLAETTTNSQATTMNAVAMLGKFDLTDASIAHIIPHLADFSAFMGEDMSAAATKFGRAIASGEVDTRRMGIALDDNEKAMFKQADTTERAQMLVEKLGKFHGFAAEQANTATGAHAQFNNAVDEMYAKVGKVIDQPLAQFFHESKDSIEGVGAAVEANSEQIKTFVEGLKSIADGLLTFVKTTLGTILNVVDGMVASFLSAFSGLGTAVSTVMDNIKNHMSIGDAISSGVKAGVADAQESFASLQKNSLFAGMGIFGNKPTEAPGTLNFAGESGKLETGGSFSTKSKAARHAAQTMDFGESVTGEKAFSGLNEQMQAGQAIDFSGPKDAFKTMSDDMEESAKREAAARAQEVDGLQQAFMNTKEFSDAMKQGAADAQNAQTFSQALAAASSALEQLGSAAGSAVSSMFQKQDSEAAFAQSQFDLAAGLKQAGATPADRARIQDQMKRAQQQHDLGQEQQKKEQGASIAGQAIGGLASGKDPMQVAGQAVLSIVASTKGFARIMETVGGVINDVIGIISPIMDGIAAAVDGVRQGFNFFIAKIADLVNKFGTDSMGNAIRSLEIPADTAATALDTFSQSVSALNSQNVPTIFKTAYENFASRSATIPLGGKTGSQSAAAKALAGGDVGLAKALSTTTNNNSNNVTVAINAANAKASEVAAEVAKIMNKKAYNQSGTPNTGQTSRQFYGA